MVKLDVRDFGWRDPIDCARCDIDHQNVLLAPF
jgi:hypothetical protein